LVGKTGTGKSFIVEQYTDAKGLSSHGQKSYTTKIKDFEFKQNKITIFDTPGFGDSEGRDGLFIRELIEKMKSLKQGLHLLIYNKISDNRLDFNDKKNLAMLNEIFDGSLNKENIIICLTKSDKDDYPEKSLEEASKIFEELTVVNFGKNNTEFLEKTILTKLDVVPVVTSYMRHIQSEEEKYKKLEKAMLAATSTEEKLKVEVKMLMMQKEDLIKKSEEQLRVQQNFVSKSDPTFWQKLGDVALGIGSQLLMKGLTTYLFPASAFIPL